MIPRFLMCAPDHFEVSYVINPWMQGNISRARSRVASQQWKRLVQMLSQVAQIERIAAMPGVPDMVFTANAGLVLENKVIISCFRHPQRKAEEAYFAQWFGERGFELLKLPAGLSFEGAGDALLDRALPLVWLGHGHRSQSECAVCLSELLSIDVEPLQLTDPRFYHLDTCFCPLAGGYLMYYPQAFNAASQARIKERVPASRRIEVSNADAVHFACNAVNCGQHIFLNRASEALIAELASHGFIVRQTPLSEFMKAGGAAKCLTLKLDESRPALPIRVAA